MLCGSGPVHVKDAQQEGAANKDVWHAKGSGGGAGPRKPSTAEGTAGHAEGRQCNARQNGSMARPPAGFAGQIHNSSASVTYWHVGQKLRKEDLPYPRPNTWLEEAIAVVTMLMFFGWVVFRLFHAALPVMAFTRPAYHQLFVTCRAAWLLPPLLLASIIGSLVYGSRLCTSVLALFLAAYLAPPGKVCLSRRSFGAVFPPAFGLVKQSWCCSGGRRSCTWASGTAGGATSASGASSRRRPSWMHQSPTCSL